MNIKTRIAFQYIINFLLLVLGVEIVLMLVFNKANDMVLLGILLSLTSSLMFLRTLFIKEPALLFIFNLIFGLSGISLGLCAAILNKEVFSLSLFCRLWAIYEICEGVYDIFAIFVTPKRPVFITLIELLQGITKIFFGIGLVIFLDEHILSHLIFVTVLLTIQLPIFYLHRKLERS